MVVVERCLIFLVGEVSLTSFATAARLAPDEHPAFSGTAKERRHLWRYPLSESSGMLSCRIQRCLLRALHDKSVSVKASGSDSQSLTRTKNGRRY